MSEIGKQTKKAGSEFGGEWTKAKLTILEKYLSFYVRALKNQKVKLTYIDAFAGSGKTSLPTGDIEGSASIAMKYDFDQYFFIEYDQNRLLDLKKYISEKFPQKAGKVSYLQGDCNEELIKVFNGLNKYQRGVMFLDPYAMEMRWEVLQAAQKTEILDIWYLFPVMAVNRNLKNDGEISESVKQKISAILPAGWYEALYYENPQMNMWNFTDMRKVNTANLIAFIQEKIKGVFPHVATKPVELKNSKNSLQFLLCFMISNPSPKAGSLAKKVVEDIVDAI
ncbi:MAG: three-Cys-motif partner protein TcmP [Firmicutes bacterium]|nr:three-Cys-motif partner protein TcmP [Bacillota bacterium]